MTANFSTAGFMKDKHVKTVLYWVVLSILFIGIIGYEWLPIGYRGSWLLILFLTICGAFVKFKNAIFIGLAAFFLVSIYFLFDLSYISKIERQILLLFTVTFSPLFLSAVRYNLLSDYFNNKAANDFNNDYSTTIFPIETWGKVTLQLSKMLPFFKYPNYEIINIKIKNHQLITEMLGESIWLKIKNKILDLLIYSSTDATYLFADKNVTEIKCVIFRCKPDSNNLPSFVQEIRNIPGIDIDVQYVVRDVQASLKEGKYVSVH